MPENIAEWLERQSDRIVARQRSQVDTAKLVATFASGIAATLVATALQVAPNGGWDIAAVALLAVAVLGTIAVIALDRLKEANHSALQDKQKVFGWTDDRLLQELRAAAIAAADTNGWVLTAVRSSAVVQVIVAMLSGAASVISLLS